MNDNVMHAIDLGVAALRDELQRSQAVAAALQSESDAKTSRIDYLGTERDKHKKRADETASRLYALQRKNEDKAHDCEKVQAGLTTTRDQFNDLVTALNLYVGELESARDAERVKSTKVALGHIVERLRLMHTRGTNGFDWPIAS